MTELEQAAESQNAGERYIYETRLANPPGNSTIFAEIECRDEDYIRVSHAEHACRLTAQWQLDRIKAVIEKRLELTIEDGCFVTSTELEHILKLISE